jgi:hypothetical protein
MNDAIRRMIIAGGSALDIRKTAIQSGMITLRRAGLLNAMRGVTTFDEIMRHTVGEDVEEVKPVKKTEGSDKPEEEEEKTEAAAEK